MFLAIHMDSPKKNLHAILFELFAQDSLGQNRGHAYGTPQRVEQF
jgi:hypothetical protein